jgi:hypothetical protein
MLADAIGDGCTFISLNAPHTPLGAAQAAIFSQVASQGTGDVDVHHSDMAMHVLTTAI